VGRENGVSTEQLLALADYRTSSQFDDRERAALDYADRITATDQDVDDATFALVKDAFTDEEIVELTATIALENFLSKFHRALRVDAHGFCLRLDAGIPVRQPS
jgi:alkylhydroperoxidase family enzyme